MAKRNNDHLSLSEVLKAFVETNKLDKGIDKIQVQNAWSDLMGPGVNNYTQEVTGLKMIFFMYNFPLPY